MGLSKKGPITPWKGSWAHSMASDRGMNAAYRGEPYDSNPYRRGSPEHLAWSEAHNGARANRILKEEGR
jgi:hypothetical protein